MCVKFVIWIFVATQHLSSTVCEKRSDSPVGENDDSVKSGLQETDISTTQSMVAVYEPLESLLLAAPHSVFLLSKLLTSPNDFPLNSHPTTILRHDRFFAAVVQVTNEFLDSFTKVNGNIMEISAQLATIPRSLTGSLNSLFGSGTPEQISAFGLISANSAKDAAAEISRLAQAFSSFLSKCDLILNELIEALPKIANEPAQELENVKQHLAKTNKLLQMLQSTAVQFEGATVKYQSFFNLDGLDAKAFLERRFDVKDTLFDVFDGRSQLLMLTSLYLHISSNYVTKDLAGAIGILAITDPQAKEAKRQELEAKWKEDEAAIRLLINTQQNKTNKGRMGRKSKIDQTINDAKNRLTGGQKENSH